MEKKYIPIKKEEILKGSFDGLVQLKIDLMMGKLRPEWFDFPIGELYDLIQNEIIKRNNKTLEKYGMIINNI
jgi:uncharacterized membrane protein